MRLIKFKFYNLTNLRKLGNVIISNCSYNRLQQEKKVIIVSRERQKKMLFLDDIYYFEIKGRVVDVHGPEGIFTYYEQIGELEDNSNCV